MCIVSTLESRLCRASAACYRVDRAHRQKKIAKAHTNRTEQEVIACALDGRPNRRNETKRTNERCNLYYENLLWCHIKYIGCCSIVLVLYTISVCVCGACPPVVRLHRTSNAQANRATSQRHTAANTAIHRALLIQFIRFYKYFSVIFIGCVSLTCVSIACDATSPRVWVCGTGRTSDNTNAWHTLTAHVQHDGNRQE